MQHETTRNNPHKKPPVEHTQTLIIPKITPEVLEAARRAAERGEEMQLPEAQPLNAPQTQPATAPRPENKQQAAAKFRPADHRASALQVAKTTQERRFHDDHLWLNNPVMLRGLGLAPLVVVATNGANAWMLCVAAMLLLTTTRVLAVAICHANGNRMRPLVYCYSAALLYIPAYIILYQIFGTGLSALGIYLPLLAVEPVIVKRMESPELETVGEAVRKGLNNTAGLCIATLLIGGLRELLAAGTLFGGKVLQFALLPLAARPSGGFILLGVVAAFWTGVVNAYKSYKRKEVEALYAKRTK